MGPSSAATFQRPTGRTPTTAHSYHGALSISQPPAHKIIRFDPFWSFGGYLHQSPDGVSGPDGHMLRTTIAFTEHGESGGNRAELWPSLKTGHS
jgi:hypothetical protein